MEFKLQVISQVEFKYELGAKQSQLKSVQFRLDVEGDYPFDRRPYFDAKGLPTKQGCEAVTVTLLTALAANIKGAEVKGYRERDEHIRYILREIERQLKENPKLLEDYLTLQGG